MPLVEVGEEADPLLSLAGQFSASISDIGTDHDRYIGVLAHDLALAVDEVEEVEIIGQEISELDMVGAIPLAHILKNLDAP